MSGVRRDSRLFLRRRRMNQNMNAARAMKLMEPNTPPTTGPAEMLEDIPPPVDVSGAAAPTDVLVADVPVVLDVVFDVMSVDRVSMVEICPADEDVISLWAIGI